MNKLLVSVSILLLSCNSNWGNYGSYRLTYDSALEYYIVIEKGEEITLKDSKEEQEKKGTKVIFYNPSGKPDTSILGKGSAVIESYVSQDNVTYDNDFITVAQKPINKICDCDVICSSNKYKGEKVSNYNLCKSALEKSNYYEYWIIDKNKDAIYGPMSRQDYLNTFHSLKIPDELILEQ